MCITRPDLTSASWRKSTYSTLQDDNCVEIADHLPGPIPVRDSKAPTGPALLIPPAAWSAFVTAVAATHSDLSG
ncbi:DUF397 domain-containing protein [Streptomyces sp. NPDC052396]|uniref:DUF397 domain-containing protein n=1 Tax=Streptomyces sp. NPDC052396 TaxID=3365689 RepID=UPI0037CF784C